MYMFGMKVSWNKTKNIRILRIWLDIAKYMTIQESVWLDCLNIKHCFHTVTVEHL